MDPDPKRIRLNPNETQIDRISELPDALISYILSFLPTKQAVAASFISTRWLSVLYSSPNLELYFKDHKMENVRFANFVDGVLSNCVKMDSSLHTLGFSCRREHEDHIIERWFNEAAKLKVRTLQMWVEFPSERLGECIGSCKFLTTLRLVGCSTLDVPDSFCLPKLKYLNLRKVVLYEETSLANLVKGCPLVEDLSLDFVRLFGRIIEICSPLLKRLFMQKCSIYEYHDEPKEIMNYEITLDTPALEDLWYDDNSAASRYTVKEPNCIRTAHLDVKSSKKQDEEEGGVDFGLSVARLVKACSKTEYLYLSDRLLLAILYSHRLLTLFPNLKKMELGFINVRKWRVFLHLLDCAPELVSLCVELLFHDHEWHADLDPALSIRVPDCFAKNFTTCSILNFSGANPGFDVVAFFLKHAKYLQKMVISFNCGLKVELWSKDILQAFPRCSETCQVAFSTNGAKTRSEFHAG